MGYQPVTTTKPKRFASKSNVLLDGARRLNSAQWRCAQLLANELYIDLHAAFFYLEEADWHPEVAKRQFCKYFLVHICSCHLGALPFFFNCNPKVTIVGNVMILSPLNGDVVADGDSAEERR